MYILYKMKDFKAFMLPPVTIYPGLVKLLATGPGDQWRTNVLSHTADSRCPDVCNCLKF